MATYPKPLAPVLNVGSFLVDQLVMALPMSEGAGATLADISGNGHDATIAGVEGVDFQWVTDPEMGVVLELLTASSWLDLAATLAAAYAGQGAATLQCWVKLVDPSPASPQRGFANFDSLSGVDTRTVYPNTTGGAEIQTAVFRQTTREDFALDLGVDRDEWHLLTITTQNGGFYYVYQNDIQIGGVVAESTVAITAPFQFGRSDDSTPITESMRALIGDLRLWRRAVQDFEVGSIFNNPWSLYLFNNPPGQVELFGVSQDYLPRGLASMHEVALLADLPTQGRVGVGEFVLLADLNAETPGGAYDTPPTLDTRLSPLRKPAIAGTPLPSLNGAAITTNLELALLYNDPAGATDPITDYANALVASGITWGTAAVEDGQPDGDAVFPLTQQDAAAFANGDGGTILDNAVLKPVTDFSIAAAVAFPSLPLANGVIVGKYNSTQASFAYALRIDADNDRIKFEMTDLVDGVATVISAANPTISAGDKAIIVGTYDGAIMRLYINGVEVGNTPNGGSLDHGTDPLGIGQDGLGGTLVGGNAHTEFAYLWSRALTPDEAIALTTDSPFGMFCDSALVELLGVSHDYVPRGVASAHEVALLADLPLWPANGAQEFGLLADLVPGVVNAAGLTFLSISPTVGPDQGGQLVTIKGRGFVGITQVLLGGFALGSLTVVDEATITGITPVHLPGAVPIRIDSAERGFVEAQAVYTFVGGFGPASGQLIQGNQLQGDTLWRQEPFTGETAPLGVQTTLALTLADIPVHPNAVEVYVRRLDAGHGTTDDGGLLMRPGAAFTYTVDIANRKIIWEPNAPFELLPGDEILVLYAGRGEV